MKREIQRLALQHQKTDVVNGTRLHDLDTDL